MHVSSLKVQRNAGNRGYIIVVFSLRLAVNISQIKKYILEKRVSYLETEEYKCRINFVNVAKKDEHPKRGVLDILTSIAITLDERSVIYMRSERGVITNTELGRSW